MRTASEILNNWDWGNESDIIESMKEYAEEVLEECAKRAKVKIIGEHIEDDVPRVYVPAYEVDKESILSLIKELK